MLLKIAQATFQAENALTPEIALNNETATERFKELISGVKKVARKSNEFVYFVCRAIHAMEASNINLKTGEIIGDGHISVNDGNGKCKICQCDLEKTPNGIIIEGLWHSTQGVEPYINQNGDAFPEYELLREREDGTKAYETFIGRGLFVNHKSDDAEAIRGIILDAMWDSKTKGVDILVACDRVAYPQLARQIEQGYSNDVSMGTRVSHSICSICGNKAVTENDYCEHVKANKGLRLADNRRVYEINNGLEFIEISVVANGADPQAKIRQVLASLRTVVEKRSNDLEALKHNANENNIEEIHKIESELEGLKEKIARLDNCSDELNKESKVLSILERKQKRNNLLNQIIELASMSNEPSLVSGREDMPIGESTITRGDTIMSSKTQKEKKAYFQGTEEPKTYAVDPLNDQAKNNLDKQMVGQGMDFNDTGLAGDDAAVKEKLYRAQLEDRRKKREALLERMGYYQGTEEPTTYPKDPINENCRDNLDKQMVGEGMEPGDTGLAGDDASIKEKLYRASLRAKFVKADNRNDSYWTLYAGSDPILTATVKQLYGGILDDKNVDDTNITNWDWVSSRDYGINLIRAVKQSGFEKVSEQLFGKTVEGADNLAKQGQASDMLPNPEPGLDAMPELPQEEIMTEEIGEEGTTLSPQEQIREAIDNIQEAVEQIRIVNEGEDEVSLESMEAEENLMDSEEELMNLNKELGASKDENRIKKVEAIVKDALDDASVILKQANKIISASKKVKAGDKKDKVKAQLNLDEGQSLEVEVEMENEDEEDKDKGEEKEASQTVSGTGKVTEQELKERKAKRHAIAQALYNVNPYDAVDEAHPNGGTHTEAGGKPVEGDAHIETTKEQQSVDLQVATGQPRGELTAAQKTRRELVAQFNDQVEEVTEEDIDEATAEANTRTGTEKKAAEGVPPHIHNKLSTLVNQGKSFDEAKSAIANEFDNFQLQKEDYDELSTKASNNQATKEAGKIKGPGKPDGTGPCNKDPECQMNKEEKEASVDNKEKEVKAEVENEQTYYTKEYGDAQFASDLLKDYSSQKATASDHDLKLRMKRAYQVALQQQKLGQIGPSVEDLEAQVDRLVNMDATGFANFAAAVENTSTSKKVESKDEKRITVANLRPGIEESDVSFTDQLSKINWT